MARKTMSLFRAFKAKDQFLNLEDVLDQKEIILYVI